MSESISEWPCSFSSSIMNRVASIPMPSSPSQLKTPSGLLGELPNSPLEEAKAFSGPLRGSLLFRSTSSTLGEREMLVSSPSASSHEPGPSILPPTSPLETPPTPSFPERSLGNSLSSQGVSGLPQDDISDTTSNDGTCSNPASPQSPDSLEPGGDGYENSDAAGDQDPPNIERRDSSTQCSSFGYVDYLIRQPRFVLPSGGRDATDPIRANGPSSRFYGDTSISEGGDTATFNNDFPSNSVSVCIPSISISTSDTGPTLPSNTNCSFAVTSPIFSNSSSGLYSSGASSSSVSESLMDSADSPVGLGETLATTISCSSQTESGATTSSLSTAGPFNTEFLSRGINRTSRSSLLFRSEESCSSKSYLTGSQSRSADSSGSSSQPLELGDSTQLACGTFHSSLRSTSPRSALRVNVVNPTTNTAQGAASDTPASYRVTRVPEIGSLTGYHGFPSEPTILADRYIILGSVDVSTVNALHVRTHEPVHIKAVTSQSAREVCAQQSLLSCEDCGVRFSTEAIVSPGGGPRAWLVFPPHYGDLHLYVRMRKRLREAEAQRLFTQMARTVEKCHEAGLVLRDLKLRKFVFADVNRENVWLESVEDSVACGAVDLLQDKHGCPAYVAPEILSASAYSGRHADMWGMGVILYTMLVGRYPFHNNDTATLFAKIRLGKFTIPEWVSSRARHLILSLLRRQPNRRLSARQVLQHPWITHTPRDHAPKDPMDQMVPGGKVKSMHGYTEGKH